MRLDARLPHRLVPDRLRPAEEACAHVVLAPERLHHLDPDDRLVGRLGEVALLLLHEPGDGEEPVCEEKVRTAIGGSASAEKSASRAFTFSRTIAAATIIIALWTPCTTPQPMK